MLSLDVVRIGTILLSRNRDTTSEGSKGSSTTYGIGAVVRVASRVKDTLGIDNKSLNVRVASSKNLASIDSAASDNRGVLAVA